MNAFFFQRINDHIQYLRKLEKTLKDEGDFQGSTHTDCKLGKWMYGEGRQEVTEAGDQAVAVFESLFDKHQAFHDASARALVAKNGGQADAMNKEVTEMIKLSNTLIASLTELDRLGRK